MSAYDLAFERSLPLGQRFEAFAKIGYSLVKVDSTPTQPLITTTAEASNRKFTYGVGVAMKLGKRFGIRAEYAGWDVEGQLDEWSPGPHYRFGGR